MQALPLQKTLTLILTTAARGDGAQPAPLRCRSRDAVSVAAQGNHPVADEHGAIAVTLTKRNFTAGRNGSIFETIPASDHSRSWCTGTR